ncbi:MAG: tetratricopeptide repeat protein, partial [Bryobacteraceae bacterium]
MKLLILIFAASICLRAQGSDPTQTVLSIQNAIQRGDLVSASRLIDAALEKQPGNGGLLNLRGIVHAQRNELPEARRDFAEAVRRAPDLMPAWQNLARACQFETPSDASSVSCAVDAWQHVLRSKPDDGEAHGALASLYETQGKYRESLRETERLSAGEASEVGNLAIRCIDLCALDRISEAKTVASRLAALAEFSESDFNGMYRSLGSPPSAPVVVILIEGLDTRRGASPSGLRRLAVAYEAVHRPLDASKTLERVASQEPDNVADLLELARLADRTKDHQGALGYLAHARDIEPNNARIHFLFAMTAAEMDLPVEARRSLDRALAL